MVALIGDSITLTTSFSLETLPRLYRSLVWLIKEAATPENNGGATLEAVQTVCTLLDEILPMEGQVFLMPDGLAVINNSISGEAPKGHAAAVLVNLQKSATNPSA